MNHTSTKAMIASAAAFAAMNFSGAVWAHDQLGQLGGKKNATDVWEVTCSGGSSYLVLQIKDAPPNKAPKVSVQVVKDRLGGNSTDPRDADEDYSPELRIFGGDGTYVVLVNKTAAPAENYSLEYHCEGNGGAHTATTAALFQNQ